MEWRKAVNILLVSFIVLNIFMLLNLWFIQRPSAQFALTPEQKYEIERYLKQNGVIVKGDMPEEGRPQALLEVRLSDFDEDKIVKKFFGKDAQPQVNKTKDGTNYTYKSQQLIIADNGFITYFDSNDKVVWTDLTIEKAEKEALNFIKNLGGILEDAVLDGITSDERNNGYLVEFVRSFDGFVLDNSFATVMVTPSGIKTYYQCWLEPLGYIGKRRAVISPLTAIMRVIAEAETDNQIEITKICQGYYSKIYDANRWQAGPVWKIEINDQDTFYVNAYSGEMER